MNRGAINLGNPVSSSPLNRGLVGWWLALPQRMGGLTFVDLCNRNHATLTNTPTWASGAGRPSGYGSVRMAGSTQQLVVTGNPLSGLSECTVACWFMAASNFFAVNAPVRCLDFGSTGDGYRLLLDSANPAKMNFIISEAFSSGTAISDAAFPTNTWTHCVGTLSTGGAVTLYINGVAQSTTATKVATFSHTVNLTMGQDSDASKTGNQDDMRLWNRCLPADQVMALYNDSRLNYPQTLNRLPMRVYGTAGGAGSFQAAWARGSNVIIQPTVSA